MPHNIHSSTIYNSQDMEETQEPINRQMNKDFYIHKYYV